MSFFVVILSLPTFFLLATSFGGIEVGMIFIHCFLMTLLCSISMTLSRWLGLAFGVLWGMAIATQIGVTEILQETSFFVALLFGFLGSFLGLFAGKVFPFISHQK